MCQLFLAVRHKHTPKLLQQFLKKSETENLKDGYGISWISGDKWSGINDPNNVIHRSKTRGLWRTYKKPIAAFADFPPLRCGKLVDNSAPLPYSKMPNIDSDIVLAHLRYIDKAKMEPSDVREEINLQNTHPFTYGNWVFAHHGDIFYKNQEKLWRYHVSRREPRFQKAISKLYEFISPKHQKLIKGDTDSEILFHLFLSILENLDPMDEKDAMMHSFTKMLDILHKNNIENSSNFILVNGDCILVANIYSNHSGLPLKRVGMFIDDTDGLLVCSSKMTDGSKKIKSNYMFIV
jgi:predicted glutamine amidotransferase